MQLSLIHISVRLRSGQQQLDGTVDYDGRYETGFRGKNPVSYTHLPGGVAAGPAGTISSVGLFVSAGAALVVGYLSDNCKNPNGRRRPFIKVAIPVLLVAMILLFSDFGFSGTTAILYYGTLVTVSYTHLDVYKRQIQSCSQICALEMPSRRR